MINNDYVVINVESKKNYILRIFLDNNSVIDFDVKAEIERIPCYKSLYDTQFFKTVKFKNQRIYWNDQFNFHLDQIFDRGHVVKNLPRI